MAVPHRSTSRRPRRLPVVAALLALVLVLSACAEDIEGGAACPALCPGTNVPLRDTVLDAVSFARTVAGIPIVGDESIMPLADRDGTLQTRIVLRYDTLVVRYKFGTTDSTTALPAIHSAGLKLRLDRAASTVPDTFQLSVYDVTGAGDDTTSSTIEAQLTEARLVGRRIVGRADVADSVEVPLDSAFVSARVTGSAGPRRLRLAVAVSAARPVLLRVRTSPELFYSAPEQTNRLVVVPFSSAPAGDIVTAAELRDFVTIPVRTPLAAADLLAVGGLPARRSLLRFELPASIVDTATIVSAELILVQAPSPDAGLMDSVVIGTGTTATTVARSDTVVVLPLIGVGSASVSDPARAAQLAIRSIRLSRLDSLFVPALRLLPAGSGVQRVEVAPLLRRWRQQPMSEPRYIVLQAQAEGAQSAAVYFHGPTAAQAELRPRLHIRYVPRVGYGIP